MTQHAAGAAGPAGARPVAGPVIELPYAPGESPVVRLPPPESDTERLRRLQQVTAELSRAMTSEEVVGVVLRRGMELEGAGSGSMWLVDDGALRVTGTIGLLPGVTRTFAHIPLDADLPAAAVVASRQPVFLRSRADRDTRWPALAGTPTAMEAIAVVPLVVDDRAIGCLSYGFPDEKEFGEGERDFLVALANVCAQVLDRARLYDAERAASRRVAFLADASRLLNSSLDYPTTLQRVVSLVLEAFAALVVVDLIGGDGQLERVAMGHVDPTKRDVLEQLRGNPVRPGTAGWDVLRTGEPRVIAEVTEADIRRAAADEQAYAAALAMDIGPAVVVPLTARGGVVGALYLARPRGAAPFGDDDVALAVDLAARAGSAVDNARLFAARTAVAETLQRSLLPPRLPDVPGLELAARYRPLHAGLEGGGDFYDCYAVRDGWAFVIGDVVGNGPRAAAVTALVRHTARAVAPYVPGPAEVVHAVRDAILAGGDDEVFCTLLYGAVDRAADGGVLLRVVGAGHPPPYVVRAGGTIDRVPTSGSLLGVVPPVGLEPVDVTLAPGDTLVCVTDGVLEARRAPSWDDPDPGGRFFDELGLVGVLRAHAGTTADELAGAIEAAVLEFTGGRAPDDVAVLVLRATG